MTTQEITGDPLLEVPFKSTGNSRDSLGLRLEYSSIHPTNNNSHRDDSQDFGEIDEFEPEGNSSCTVLFHGGGGVNQNKGS